AEKTKKTGVQAARPQPPQQPIRSSDRESSGVMGRAAGKKCHVTPGTLRLQPPAFFGLEHVGMIQGAMFLSREQFSADDSGGICSRREQAYVQPHFAFIG